ncbi:MAG: aspartate--tRNA ligase [Planctomycetes bacterium]|nr:aspartate--tRNA ligase [Planctomycetota bacterium]
MSLRTHTCGELRASHIDQPATLAGWVENRRDHGGVFFIDIRDRYGVTQVVFNPGTDAHKRASEVGPEYCIHVAGMVRRRPDGTVNKERGTGEIEVVAQSLEILNASKTPPFEIVDRIDTAPELRMKYRYLDLRRRPMQRALVARAEFCRALRNHLASQQFVEVETPMLTKATPEGARDYLVPSRVHAGHFYALPQSPQIFKQILMIAGMDRYFQVARCLRDEDLRADRQPEFTQIDLEMSFVEPEDVWAQVEGSISAGFAAAFGVDLQPPFPRIAYKEAMLKYGIDKPDLRFGMQFVDLTDYSKSCNFKVFREAADSAGLVGGGIVRGVNAKGAGGWSRKEIDALSTFAQEHGGKGVAWLRVVESGLDGSIAKFFSDGEKVTIREMLAGQPGDLLLFGAGDETTVNGVMGPLRHHLGDKLGLRKFGTFKCAWIRDFPMFERNTKTGAIEPTNHPFTSPTESDLNRLTEKLQNDPLSLGGRGYDLVMNGWELGSGSIRIHRRDMQERIFEFLGLKREEYEAKFGFLLEALEYGAPPHGGFAYGVDRTIALGLGLDSLRDAVAFPKTSAAADPMTGAPSPVSDEQLRDVHIRTIE